MNYAGLQEMNLINKMIYKLSSICWDDEIHDQTRMLQPLFGWNKQGPAV